MRDRRRAGRFATRLPDAAAILIDVTGWYPLNVRESGDYDSYDALSEGIPPWLLADIAELITIAFNNPEYGYAITPKVRRCSAAIRTVLPDGLSRRASIQWYSRQGHEDPQLVLTVLDYLVRTEDEDEFRRALEAVLDRGNSAWTVGKWGDGHAGLVRRVDATVTVAAAQAISAKSTASHHLAEAWQAAYGLNGDPSHAYRDAIKAVEFAAIPVVSPNNATATLGTVIGQVRADGDWVVPLTRERDSGYVAGMLLSMLEALWVGQSDRHGSALPPIPITTDAAQAAVLMAATLVQWFQSGAVRRGTI